MSADERSHSVSSAGSELRSDASSSGRSGYSGPMVPPEPSDPAVLFARPWCPLPDHEVHHVAVRAPDEMPAAVDWHLAQFCRAPTPALRALLRDHPAACCLSLAVEASLGRDAYELFLAWHLFAHVPVRAVDIAAARPRATRAGLFLIWRPLPGVRLTDDPLTLDLLRYVRESLDLPLGRALSGSLAAPDAPLLPHRGGCRLLARVGFLGLEVASAGAVLWNENGLVDDISLPWGDADTARNLRVGSPAPQPPRDFPAGSTWPAGWRNVPPPMCWSLRVLLRSLPPLPAPIVCWPRPRPQPSRLFQVWAEFDPGYARTALFFPGMVGGAWLTCYRAPASPMDAPVMRAALDLHARAGRDEQPTAFLVLLPGAPPPAAGALAWLLSWDVVSLRCYSDASCRWAAPARRPAPVPAGRP